MENESYNYNLEKVISVSKIVINIHKLKKVNCNYDDNLENFEDIINEAIESLKKMLISENFYVNKLELEKIKVKTLLYYTDFITFHNDN